MKRKKKYKVKISNTVAHERAVKAHETRRKNGTDKPWNKGLKGAQVAWNKGLTARTDPRVRKYTAKMARTSRRQFKTGARKPYTHTPEIDRKISLGKRGDKNPMRTHLHLREVNREKALLNEAKKNKPPTDIEVILRRALSELGIEYAVNVILEDISIPDAYIESLKTAIFADGGRHHAKPERRELDSMQSTFLSAFGYTVLRYWGTEIEATDFKEKLKAQLEEIRQKRVRPAGSLHITFNTRTN